MIELECNPGLKPIRFDWLNAESGDHALKIDYIEKRNLIWTR